MNGVPQEVRRPKTIRACGPSGFGLRTSQGTPFTMIPLRLFHTWSQYLSFAYFPNIQDLFWWQNLYLKILTKWQVWLITIIHSNVIEIYLHSIWQNTYICVEGLPWGNIHWIGWQKGLCSPSPTVLSWGPLGEGTRLPLCPSVTPLARVPAEDAWVQRLPLPLVLKVLLDILEIWYRCHCWAYFCQLGLVITPAVHCALC